MRFPFYAIEQINDLCNQVGALREIRTPDPLVRSQVLYPAELWARRLDGWALYAVILKYLVFFQKMILNV